MNGPIAAAPEIADDISRAVGLNAKPILRYLETRLPARE